MRYITHGKIYETDMMRAQCGLVLNNTFMQIELTPLLSLLNNHVILVVTYQYSLYCLCLAQKIANHRRGIIWHLMLQHWTEK